MSALSAVSNAAPQMWCTSWVPTWAQKIQDLYFKAIESFAEGLGRIGKILFVTYMTEFFDVCRAVFYIFWNFLFRPSFIDHKEISQTQSESHATLFIHGNYHNSSAFLPLMHQMTKTKKGPLYTVDLHAGAYTPMDADIIERKIQDIRAQYRAHGSVVTIDIVAHSRGAKYALDFKNSHPDIGKVVLLGGERSSQDPDVHVIDAQWDLLVPKASGSLNYRVANTGHLGLLYNSIVQKQVIELLPDV